MGIFAIGEYLGGSVSHWDAVFLFFGVSSDLNLVRASAPVLPLGVNLQISFRFYHKMLSSPRLARFHASGMHIPRSKIGELAHQTKNVGIFAKGEYLGGGIPLA